LKNIGRFCKHPEKMEISHNPELCLLCNGDLTQKSNNWEEAVKNAMSALEKIYEKQFFNLIDEIIPFFGNFGYLDLHLHKLQITIGRCYGTMIVKVSNPNITVADNLENERFGTLVSMAFSSKFHPCCKFLSIRIL
jgi:hypothetical protein